MEKTEGCDMVLIKADLMFTHVKIVASILNILHFAILVFVHVTMIYNLHNLMDKTVVAQNGAIIYMKILTINRLVCQIARQYNFFEVFDTFVVLEFTQQGHKCVFPFIYDGIAYNKCTKYKNLQQKCWCSKVKDQK